MKTFLIIFSVATTVQAIDLGDYYKHQIVLQQVIQNSLPIQTAPIDSNVYYNAAYQAAIRKQLEGEQTCMECIVTDKQGKDHNGTCCYK